jgi:hypothetical protein
MTFFSLKNDVNVPISYQFLLRMCRYKILVSSDSSFSMFSLPPAGELFSGQEKCRGGTQPDKKDFK